MRGGGRAAPAALLFLLAGPAQGAEVDLKTVLAGNPSAYIPPSCYTRTQDARGLVHNPCYTCHTASREPNYVNDGDLQLAYDFPEPAARNPWGNLFKDRRVAVAGQSDADILAWVRSDNYARPRGLILPATLKEPPAAWDVDGDQRWSGYVPDIWFRFDADGFDRDPQGAATGWRAYAYYPLPGSFWPTNGSADDVAIRLPAAFREDADGREDAGVYTVNLAIVEALAKAADVPIPPADERALGVDLDRDGALGVASRIRFAFDPRRGETMSYAGRARQLQAEGRLHLAAGLFPEGTEFVHSLRYLDPGEDGEVRAAARMKELRYARKRSWRTYYDLQEEALAEIKEASDYPDRLRRIFGDAEHGLSNGQGWVYQGFIEAGDGALRPQSYEESLTCVGCHGGVGRTVDGIFSLPRKVDDPGFRFGWYYWPDRVLGRLPDRGGEYRTYLERNAAGDEFRANDEVMARFIGADGKLKPEPTAALAESIAALVMPSAGRALELDKAYRVIVAEQSYALGRVPVTAPLDAAVHRAVEVGSSTGIETPSE